MTRDRAGAWRTVLAWVRERASDTAPNETSSARKRDAAAAVITNEALTRQLLHWLGQQPRPYADTMEAWRTSCPRLTIWEDAMTAGLIERVPGSSTRAAQVRVTAAGQAYLRREA